jgi:hypothetical protein
MFKTTGMKDGNWRKACDRCQQKKVACTWDMTRGDGASTPAAKKAAKRAKPIMINADDDEYETDPDADQVDDEAPLQFSIVNTVSSLATELALIRETFLEFRKTLTVGLERIMEMTHKLAAIKEEHIAAARDERLIAALEQIAGALEFKVRKVERAAIGIV